MRPSPSRPVRVEFDVSWLDETLDHLAHLGPCGYAPGTAAATEPTALAALALVASRRRGQAASALEFLAGIQNSDGQVSVRTGDTEPGWPTSLAVLAWSSANRSGRYQSQIDQAVAWILSDRGQPIEQSSELGHDTQLVGWSYAANTHSWIEPTALHVAALKAAGHGGHARVREAVRLIFDRQLPRGGCNYGNTTVLGQTLRPHVQPTGIALIAVADESDSNGRMAKSAAWLQQAVNAQTTACSLGWAMLGLRKAGIRIPSADEWLAASVKRVQSHDRSPHKLALLALAAKGMPV